MLRHKSLFKENLFPFLTLTVINIYLLSHVYKRCFCYLSLHPCGFCRCNGVLRLLGLIVQVFTSSLISAAVKTVAVHCIIVIKSEVHMKKNISSVKFTSLCNEIPNSWKLLWQEIASVSQWNRGHPLSPLYHPASRSCSDYLRCVCRWKMDTSNLTVSYFLQQVTMV